MKKAKEKTETSDTITNEVFNSFIICYKKLEKGQKQNLHRLIISQLQIPYKEGTIRAYCTNFNRIPDEKRQFFVSLILGGMITLYNQLTDQWSEEILTAKEAINILSKTLKSYGTQRK